MFSPCALVRMRVLKCLAWLAAHVSLTRASRYSGAVLIASAACFVRCHTEKTYYNADYPIKAINLASPSNCSMHDASMQQRTSPDTQESPATHTVYAHIRINAFSASGHVYCMRSRSQHTHEHTQTKTHIHTQTHTYTHRHRHRHRHRHTHTHTHTYTHRHTYTYTHIHTHAPASHWISHLGCTSMMP